MRSMDKNCHNPGLDMYFFVILYINLFMKSETFFKRETKVQELDVMDTTIKIMTLADKYISPVLYT